MLRVDGVKKEERLLVVERFWAKAWDLEWVGFRFGENVLFIDTGHKRLARILVSAWLNLPVSYCDNEVIDRWDHVMAVESDG